MTMDNKTWKVIIKGWIPPKVTTEDDTKSMKRENDWLKEEDEEACCFIFGYEDSPS